MENRQQTGRESVFMKIQKWLILLIVFALMAGTAVLLTRLKASQKLGQPGIKATPIPGSVMMQINLPERVLDFASTNVPEPELVLSYLPKDTSYAERFYEAPDGFGVTGTIILMGADRTSIHRPEYCFQGQGWDVESKTEVKIPIAGAAPYELPVMKWVTRKTVETADGQKQEIRGVYVFWFVADNELATGNVRLQCDLMRDLLLEGILQRWAYISYFTACAPGQEEDTFARMTKLIAASVPDFQLPPAKR
jgi:hypothetical protein